MIPDDRKKAKLSVGICDFNFCAILSIFHLFYRNFKNTWNVNFQLPFYREKSLHVWMIKKERWTPSNHTMKRNYSAWLLDNLIGYRLHPLLLSDLHKKWFDLCNTQFQSKPLLMTHCEEYHMLMSREKIIRKTQRIIDIKVKGLSPQFVNYIVLLLLPVSLLIRPIVNVSFCYYGDTSWYKRKGMNTNLHLFFQYALEVKFVLFSLCETSFSGAW